MKTVEIDGNKIVLWEDIRKLENKYNIKFDFGVITTITDKGIFERDYRNGVSKVLNKIIRDFNIKK